VYTKKNKKRAALIEYLQALPEIDKPDNAGQVYKSLPVEAIREIDNLDTAGQIESKSAVAAKETEKPEYNNIGIDEGLNAVSAKYRALMYENATNIGLAILKDKQKDYADWLAQGREYRNKINLIEEIKKEVKEMTGAGEV
jgi:hypothetical protein